MSAARQETPASLLHRGGHYWCTGGNAQRAEMAKQASRALAPGRPQTIHGHGPSGECTGGTGECETLRVGR